MPPSPPHAAHLIEFPPFQLDLRAGALRRATMPVPLRPKTFGVLQYLVQRPGELVSKEALLDAVWGDVAVTEDVVRLSIRELRLALGDERATPRFIETVMRRGYRFIAATGASPVAAWPVSTDDASEPAVVVGRDRERAQLADAFVGAASGRRRVMFVSGEAGIGKTTLVDRAVEDFGRAAGPRPLVGRGQCVDQYGDGEPYLPILEAIAALCRGTELHRVEGVLARHGPDWLVRVLGLRPPGVAAGAPSTPAPRWPRGRLVDAWATPPSSRVRSPTRPFFLRRSSNQNWQ